MISHRVFFTIDEDAHVVHVIDIVHTAQQTKLDEYTAGKSSGPFPHVWTFPVR